MIMPAVSQLIYLEQTNEVEMPEHCFNGGREQRARMGKIRTLVFGVIRQGWSANVDGSWG